MRLIICKTWLKQCRSYWCNIQLLCVKRKYTRNFKKSISNFINGIETFIWTIVFNLISNHSKIHYYPIQNFKRLGVRLITNLQWLKSMLKFHLKNWASSVFMLHALTVSSIACFMWYFHDNPIPSYVSHQLINYLLTKSTTIKNILICHNYNYHKWILSTSICVLGLAWCVILYEHMFLGNR